MTENDSKILALFRDWVTEARRAAALPDHEEDKFAEAVDREIGIRHAIADLPSAGPVGLAIKAYVLLHLTDGVDEPCGVDRCSDADAERSVEAHVWNSIIDDIVHFVPELAPFVGGVEVGFGEFQPSLAR